MFEKSFPSSDNDAMASYSPLCVRFTPNSGYIAHYAPFIWCKSPTNCDTHLAKAFFKHALVHHRTTISIIHTTQRHLPVHTGRFVIGPPDYHDSSKPYSICPFFSSLIFYKTKLMQTTPSQLHPGNFILYISFLSYLFNCMPNEPVPYPTDNSKLSSKSLWSLQK